MSHNIEKSFEKIGAKVVVVLQGNDRRVRQNVPVRLDIINKNGEEIFEISVRKENTNTIDLSTLEVMAKDRHLVLLAKQTNAHGRTEKHHFLCGHDERHFFVAAVDPVSTVAAAKASLKPTEVREQEIGMNKNKRNRRKTSVSKRQGEWFFIPAEPQINPNLIRRDEPLVRGRGSKAHTAQFAYRVGGQSVKVCKEYPNGLLFAEYKALIEESPRARFFNWRDMQRDATVYVKGRISHADHATIVLDSWHRVLMNTERRTEEVAFLD